MYFNVFMLLNVFAFVHVSKFYQSLFVHSACHVEAVLWTVCWQEAKAQQQVQQQAKIAQDLRAMFIALDEDGSGTLTREDCSHTSHGQCEYLIR